MAAAVSVVSVKAPVGPERAIAPLSKPAAVIVPLPTVVNAVTPSTRSGIGGSTACNRSAPLGSALVSSVNT